MGIVRRHVGSWFLGSYRFARRSRAKAFSVLAGGGFAGFGERSVIEPPLRLTGEARIEIGSDVYIGSDSWLQALGPATEPPAIVIGDGTSIVGHCVLSARTSIRLGRRVLLARNVYIADHQHAFGDTDRAILDQGIERVEPIEIADGAWLGENVVVAPGVRIGRGAVVGANAVVLDDVPDHSVAVGAPARVVRSFDPACGRGVVRRVLMIAYHFPPEGGAGVQRSAKLARFLPECGWQPVVITRSRAPAESVEPGRRNT